jgi:hypothetical protein
MSLCLSTTPLLLSPFFATPSPCSTLLRTYLLAFPLLTPTHQHTLPTTTTPSGLQAGAAGAPQAQDQDFQHVPRPHRGLSGPHRH